jgi:hypothetical protein
MKLTLVVRVDLGLGRDKIAAQAAHAAVVLAGEPRHAGLPGLAAGRLTLATACRRGQEQSSTETEWLPVGLASLANSF